MGCTNLTLICSLIYWHKYYSLKITQKNIGIYSDLEALSEYYRKILLEINWILYLKIKNKFKDLFTSYSDLIDKSPPYILPKWHKKKRGKKYVWLESESSEVKPSEILSWRSRTPRWGSSIKIQNFKINEHPLKYINVLRIVNVRSIPVYSTIVFTVWWKMW